MVLFHVSHAMYSIWWFTSRNGPRWSQIQGQGAVGSDCEAWNREIWSWGENKKTGLRCEILQRFIQSSFKQLVKCFSWKNSKKDRDSKISRKQSSLDWTRSKFSLNRKCWSLIEWHWHESSWCNSVKSSDWQVSTQDQDVLQVWEENRHQDLWWQEEAVWGRLGCSVCRASWEILEREDGWMDWKTQR